MATLTQNGIVYTLNADTVTAFSGKYTNDQNFDANTGLYDINQNKLNTIGVDKSVNAVEIDWNGAVLKGADLENNANLTLNTSGDLLKLIEDIQKEIYVLSAAVIALGSN